MKKRVSASNVMRVVSILGIICLLALQWVWWRNAYRAVEVDFMKNAEECLKIASSNATFKHLENSEKGIKFASATSDSKILKNAKEIYPVHSANNTFEMEYVIEEVLSLSNRPITASFLNKQFNSTLNEKFEFIPKHKLQIHRLTFEIDSINRHKYNKIALGKSSDTIYHQIGFKAYSVALFPSLMDYYIKKGAVILLISIALVLLIGTILVFQYRNINRERKFADFIVDYTRMITHDLRTPVSGIQMIFKMFQKNGTSQEGMQEKYLVEGENLSKKILLNLDNILYMAKSEQMELPVYLMEVDVRTFVEKVVNGYRERNYNPKVVRIETRYEPADFKCNMDVGLMENAFSNLLENAIKFTNVDAHLEVDCSRVENIVTFKVRDNGMGMSSEDQKRIFAIFERGSANRNQQFPGFGIGLHFVERAVKAHGGKVTVQSELGKGSEFTIRYTSTEVS